MPAFWRRRGLLARLLWPLSMLFRSVAGWRRRNATPRALPVPVVVVGGITVGGAGKTPLALWLVEALRRQGFQPGIISRGYGGRAVGVIEVCVDSAPQIVGDEPLLLKRRCAIPVYVGRNRVAAAQRLLEKYPHCDLLLSDDGLQHYALARDFEIVVLDRRGLMNGWCLPAGPLREPPERIAEVDAVVLNDAQLPPPLQHGAVFHMCLHGERFYRLGMPEQTCSAADLAGKDLHALAGIGEPQRFFDHLQHLGLKVAAHPFPDHHRYAVDDLPPCGDAILTTEKDAVKLTSLIPPRALPIWVLPVTAELDGGLDELIAHTLRKRHGRTPA